MIISKANLDALRTGFKTDFQRGVGTVKPKYQAFTTAVSSMTKVQTYGFLKEWPIFREWLGDKRVRSIEEMEYHLTNRNFEVTIGIHRDKIEDDNLGLYPSMIAGWGEEAGALKDRLSFAALAAGHTQAGYDGQNFFDDEHPVKGGVSSNVSGADAVAPWYLLCCSKSLKPVILQNRKEASFTMQTDPHSDHVFATGEFLAGGEARAAAGYTFWQLAHRSTATLDATSFTTARDAMAALTNDEGEPLGVVPTHIAYGLSNRSAAENLFKKQNLTGGESNIHYGELELLQGERLA